ncbi:MAG: hypothetical protein GC186_04765 [Rhodobacteraceae bacterium]|nr:hypothetical protein [Paracoccaceae bacterium]
MARQNRVTPEGEIVADPARGLFMGNRGCLHDDAGRIGTARWRHPHWVTCVLAFKGRRRPIMAPRRYTELFFLDEAVALAAGHRPCAECRRADYLRYRAAFASAPLSAPEMDRILHPARVTRGRAQVTYSALVDDLPSGTFLRLPDGAAPLLLTDNGLLPYTPSGYGAALPRPSQATVTVLTPAPTVLALRHGYRPVLHPTAS